MPDLLSLDAVLPSKNKEGPNMAEDLALRKRPCWKNRHRTSRVVLYDGTVLPKIDLLMVEIIQLLNRPGLRTEWCCQGNYYDQNKSGAYVAINGPLASVFCHRLLDDQLRNPNYVYYYEPAIKGRACVAADEGITVANYYGNGITIEWIARYRKFITERFRRAVNTLDKS